LERVRGAGALGREGRSTDHANSEHRWEGRGPKQCEGLLQGKTKQVLGRIKQKFKRGEGGGKGRGPQIFFWFPESTHDKSAGRQRKVYLGKMVVGWGRVGEKETAGGKGHV